MVKCDDCGRRFFSEARLKHHVRNDHGERVSCTLCNYSVTKARRHRLRDHMKTHQRPRSRNNGPLASSTITFPSPRKITTTPLQERVLWTSPPLSPLMSEWEGSPETTIGEEAELHQVVAEAMGWSQTASEGAQQPQTMAVVTSLDLPAPIEDSRITAVKLPKGSNKVVTEQDGVGPVTEQEGRAGACSMDFLADDPRYFFLGAPSSIMEGHTAQLLRATCTAVRRTGRKFKRHFLPVGYLGVRREETAVMPGETRYSLVDYWTRDLECRKTRECATQTDFHL
ncbi:hypothetical protein KP79_PYT16268 [Mizuhopecten yessoensis]|uniref:C2H2-type domain-containing protein n=1 Tax=Mizuhopecten yessoensis TaxID=6573 RepID=A0A210R6S7_MIZYE|nr:hypothetical protein KP79_PYT16268 [Mizuhopecten yessoensis]